MTTTPLPPLDVHGIYPWTVLRKDSGPWKARRAHWDSIGLDDTAGRDDVEIFRHGKSGRHHKISGGKSKFDPVLAEVLTKWYAPPGGLVIDPFAGGPTRGYVAASLGRHYYGCDLSVDQVAANSAAMSDLPSTSGAATWALGDGVSWLETIAPGTADAAIACPPYHSLERYSDNPDDLSVMTWGDHVEALHVTARGLYRALADGSFIAWVTGDLRGPDGHLRLLPEITAMALAGAGFRPVNQHILITPVGSTHRMLRRWWSSTSSAGRTHQHVWVMVKGDRRVATRRCRPC